MALVFLLLALAGFADGLERRHNDHKGKRERVIEDVELEAEPEARILQADGSYEPAKGRLGAQVEVVGHISLAYFSGRGSHLCSLPSAVLCRSACSPPNSSCLPLPVGDT